MPKLICRHLVHATIGALCCVSTTGFAASSLPDTYVKRVEALASMETLNAELLGSRSATLTLEAWCATHAMAATPKIVAMRMPDIDKPATTEQRQRLQVGTSEPIRYRRVRLMCGDRTLSEADNWYVPARLTPAMNATLESSDVPFGKVVAPLKPTRQTFAVETRWTVLPPGWELVRASFADRPDKTIDVPAILFEHHAVLYDEARHPFSEVDEHYTRDILWFGEKR